MYVLVYIYIYIYIYRLNRSEATCKWKHIVNHEKVVCRTAACPHGALTGPSRCQGGSGLLRYKLNTSVKLPQNNVEHSSSFMFIILSFQNVNSFNTLTLQIPTLAIHRNKDFGPLPDSICFVSFCTFIGRALPPIGSFRGYFGSLWVLLWAPIGHLVVRSRRTTLPGLACCVLPLRLHDFGASLSKRLLAFACARDFVSMFLYRLVDWVGPSACRMVCWHQGFRNRAFGLWPLGVARLFAGCCTVRLPVCADTNTASLVQCLCVILA